MPTPEKKRKILYYLYLEKLEGKVSNLLMEIESILSERRGCQCKIHHVLSGHLGSLCYNSFRWQSPRLFNYLPCYIHTSNSQTDFFKHSLDKFLKKIKDEPSIPN